MKLRVKLSLTLRAMMDVSWMSFFFRAVICQHIWFTLGIELPSCTHSSRNSIALIQQMMREIHFNIRTVIFPSSLASRWLCVGVNTLLARVREWGSAWVRVGIERFTIYGLFIWCSSLWSHIKLPRDVIISLMYRYRLHNFIDINRISCLLFVRSIYMYRVKSMIIITSFCFVC